MTEAERREALVEAVLPDVPFDGWSRGALAAAARRIDMDEEELRALFPGGERDAVACFSHWADRRMLDALEDEPLAAMKIRDRVATAVRARLAVLEPDREAVRRALSLLALPQNVPLGLRLLYDTVDAIWYAAGDTASDFSFYTKRGLLAGVYAATTLYWLDDRSEGVQETHAFLDRRIADVMALPKLNARLRSGLDLLPNPARLARLARRR
jgi:ubiquinone biosynthesis protein COQ9